MIERERINHIIREYIKFAPKEYKTKQNCVGGGNPQGVEQEIDVGSYEQVVHEQPRIRPWDWDTQTSLIFQDTNGSPNLDETTRPCEYQKREKKIKEPAV